jgi:hypothetical protein
MSLQAALGVASVLPGTPRPGGTLAIDVALPSRFFFVLSGLITGESERSVGSHRALWVRHDISLGAGYRHPVAAFDLSAAAFATTGWLNVEGVDFAQNNASSGLEPGVAIDGTVAYPIGSLAMWVGTGTRLWLRPQKVLSLPENATTELPHYDAWLKLGVAWRWEL